MKWTDYIKSKLSELQAQQQPQDWAAMEALLNKTPSLQPVKKIVLWQKFAAVFGVMVAVVLIYWGVNQKPTASKFDQPHKISQPENPAQPLQNSTSLSPSKNLSKPENLTSAPTLPGQPISEKIAAPQQLISSNTPKDKKDTDATASLNKANISETPASKSIASKAYDQPKFEEQLGFEVSTPTNLSNNRSLESAAKKKLEGLPLRSLEIPAKTFQISELKHSFEQIEKIVVPHQNKNYKWSSGFRWDGIYGTVGWGSDRFFANPTPTIQHEYGIRLKKDNWKVELGWGQSWHYSNFSQVSPDETITGFAAYNSYTVDSLWHIQGINLGGWQYDTTFVQQVDSFSVVLPGNSLENRSLTRSWHLPLRVGYVHTYRRFTFGLMAGAVYSRYEFAPTQFGELLTSGRTSTVWRFEVMPELGYYLTPRWLLVSQFSGQWGNHSFYGCRLGLRYLW